LRPWRTDPFRIRGKEGVEAYEERFPVRQCDVNEHGFIGSGMRFAEKPATSTIGLSVAGFFFVC